MLPQSHASIYPVCNTFLESLCCYLGTPWKKNTTNLTDIQQSCCPPPSVEGPKSKYHGTAPRPGKSLNALFSKEHWSIARIKSTKRHPFRSNQHLAFSDSLIQKTHDFFHPLSFCWRLQQTGPWRCNQQSCCSYLPSSPHNESNEACIQMHRVLSYWRWTEDNQTPSFFQPPFSSLPPKFPAKLQKIAAICMAVNANISSRNRN